MLTMITRCCTCGQRVSTHEGEEGTVCYIPKEREETVKEIIELFKKGSERVSKHGDEILSSFVEGFSEGFIQILKEKYDLEDKQNEKTE